MKKRGQFLTTFTCLLVIVSISLAANAQDTLLYVDNAVNLVVSENLGRIPTDEMMRVLCPNGVVWRIEMIVGPLRHGRDIPELIGPSQHSIEDDGSTTLRVTADSRMLSVLLIESLSAFPFRFPC